MSENKIYKFDTDEKIQNLKMHEELLTKWFSPQTDKFRICRPEDELPAADYVLSYYQQNFHNLEIVECKTDKTLHPHTVVEIITNYPTNRMSWTEVELAKMINLITSGQKKGQCTTWMLNATRNHWFSYYHKYQNRWALVRGDILSLYVQHIIEWGQSRLIGTISERNGSTWLNISVIIDNKTIDKFAKAVVDLKNV